MSMYKTAKKVMYFMYDPDTGEDLSSIRDVDDSMDPEHLESADRAGRSLGWRAAGMIAGGVAGAIAGRGMPAGNVFEKAVPAVLGAGIGSIAGRKAYELLHDD